MTVDAISSVGFKKEYTSKGQFKKELCLRTDEAVETDFGMELLGEINKFLICKKYYIDDAILKLHSKELSREQAASLALDVGGKVDDYIKDIIKIEGRMLLDGEVCEEYNILKNYSIESEKYQVNSCEKDFENFKMELQNKDISLFYESNGSAFSDAMLKIKNFPNLSDRFSMEVKFGRYNSRAFDKTVTFTDKDTGIITEFVYHNGYYSAVRQKYNREANWETIYKEY